MSKLVSHDVTYEGAPHRASVTWSYSGARKQMMVVGLRLYTIAPEPKELKRVPIDKIDALLAQLKAPEPD